jgi:hypothetical protein
MYVTASKSVRVGNLRLTSVVCTPLDNGAVSAQCTLYEATAATSGKEFMYMRCGSPVQTVVWNDPGGIELDNLFVVVGSAWATVVWN